MARVLVLNLGLLLARGQGKSGGQGGGDKGFTNGGTPEMGNSV